MQFLAVGVCGLTAGRLLGIRPSSGLFSSSSRAFQDHFEITRASADCLRAQLKCLPEQPNNALPYPSTSNSLAMLALSTAWLSPPLAPAEPVIYLYRPVQHLQRSAPVMTLGLADASDIHCLLTMCPGCALLECPQRD